MKKLSRKGQVGSISTLVMAIVGVAITLAIGLIVLSELASDQVTGTAFCNASHKTSCSAAYNGTTSVILKLATIPTWIGILITVALAFTVLAFFAGRSNR